MNDYSAVIYSASERGFWSNTDGWGHVTTATIFDYDEIRWVSLPMSEKNDAQWLTF